MHNGGSLCIVMEYCEGGDMSEMISKRRNRLEEYMFTHKIDDAAVAAGDAVLPSWLYFSEEQILNWTAQLLLGLNHIHSKHIIHRDIKPSNIFLTSSFTPLSPPVRAFSKKKNKFSHCSSPLFGPNLNNDEDEEEEEEGNQDYEINKCDLVKIGDFGVSKSLQPSPPPIAPKTSSSLGSYPGRALPPLTCIGTPQYMSPEMTSNRIYTHKTDIWGLGCVLFELCTLRPAFDGASLKEVVDSVAKGRVPTPVPLHYSHFLKSVVKRTLCPDPQLRPSVSGLLAHEELRTYLSRLQSIYTPQAHNSNNNINNNNICFNNPSHKSITSSSKGMKGMRHTEGPSKAMEYDKINIEPPPSLSCFSSVHLSDDSPSESCNTYMIPSSAFNSHSQAAFSDNQDSGGQVVVHTNLVFDNNTNKNKNNYQMINLVTPATSTATPFHAGESPPSKLAAFLKLQQLQNINLNNNASAQNPQLGGNYLSSAIAYGDRRLRFLLSSSSTTSSIPPLEGSSPPSSCMMTITSPPHFNQNINLVQCPASSSIHGPLSDSSSSSVTNSNINNKVNGSSHSLNVLSPFNNTDPLDTEKRSPLCLVPSSLPPSSPLHLPSEALKPHVHNLLNRTPSNMTNFLPIRRLLNASGEDEEEVVNDFHLCPSPSLLGLRSPSAALHNLHHGIMHQGRSHATHNPNFTARRPSLSSNAILLQPDSRFFLRSTQLLLAKLRLKLEQHSQLKDALIGSSHQKRFHRRSVLLRDPKSVLGGKCDVTLSLSEFSFVCGDRVGLSDQELKLIFRSVQYAQVQSDQKITRRMQGELRKLRRGGVEGLDIALIAKYAPHLLPRSSHHTLNNNNNNSSSHIHIHHNPSNKLVSHDTTCNKLSRHKSTPPLPRVHPSSPLSSTSNPLSPKDPLSPVSRGRSRAVTHMDVDDIIIGSHHNQNILAISNGTDGGLSTLENAFHYASPSHGSLCGSTKMNNLVNMPRRSCVNVIGHSPSRQFSFQNSNPKQPLGVVMPSDLKRGRSFQEKHPFSNSPSGSSTFSQYRRHNNKDRTTTPQVSHRSFLESHSAADSDFIASSSVVSANSNALLSCSVSSDNGTVSPSSIMHSPVNSINQYPSSSAAHFNLNKRAYHSPTAAAFTASNNHVTYFGVSPMTKSPYSALGESSKDSSLFYTENEEGENVSEDLTKTNFNEISCLSSPNNNRPSHNSMVDACHLQMNISNNNINFQHAGGCMVTTCHPPKGRRSSVSSVISRRLHGVRSIRSSFSTANFTLPPRAPDTVTVEVLAKVLNRIKNWEVSTLSAHLAPKVNFTVLHKCISRLEAQLLPEKGNIRNGVSSPGDFEMLMLRTMPSLSEKYRKRMILLSDKDSFGDILVESFLTELRTLHDEVWARHLLKQQEERMYSQTMTTLNSPRMKNNVDDQESILKLSDKIIDSDVNDATIEIVTAVNNVTFNQEDVQQQEFLTSTLTTTTTLSSSVYINEQQTNYFKNEENVLPPLPNHLKPSRCVTAPPTLFSISRQTSLDASNLQLSQRIREIELTAKLNSSLGEEQALVQLLLETRQQNQRNSLFVPSLMRSHRITYPSDREQEDDTIENHYHSTSPPLFPRTQNSSSSTVLPFNHDNHHQSENSQYVLDLEKNNFKNSHVNILMNRIRDVRRSTDQILESLCTNNESQFF